MSQEPLKNFQESVAPFLRNGSVEILANESHFITVIENNFPFVGSKIDWQQVSDVIIRSALDRSRLTEASEFLEYALQKNNIPMSTDVVIVGDSAMNNALGTKVSNLAKLLPHILELPQHTYIVSMTGEWCMSFTMEGEMAFGKSKGVGTSKN